MIDELKVRYGESFDITVESEDLTALTATLYVGKPGQVPVMEMSGTFEMITVVENKIEKQKVVTLLHADPEETEVPLGEYKYQLTLHYEGGGVRKYPTEDYCVEFGLPDFYVLEALDEQEVVS